MEWSYFAADYRGKIRTTVTEVEQRPVWISWKDWRFSGVMPLAAAERAP
jgi:hypothetical protein